jgi:hypothetical protein
LETHGGKERNGLKLIWPISIPQHYHQRSTMARVAVFFLIHRRFAIAIGFCAWITSLLAVLSFCLCTAPTPHQNLLALVDVCDVLFHHPVCSSNPTELWE